MDTYVEQRCIIAYPSDPISWPVNTNWKYKLGESAKTSRIARSIKRRIPASSIHLLSKYLLKGGLEHIIAAKALAILKGSLEVCIDDIGQLNNDKNLHVNSSDHYAPFEVLLPINRK